MLITKSKYYIYIENISLLKLDLIKKRNKFAIIYRNSIKTAKVGELRKFALKCKNKGIALYIANDLKLMKKCQATGLYLSSYNKRNYKVKNIKLLGSAHNFKEIVEKKKQGCTEIIFSRLFKTDYSTKIGFTGLIRFNLISRYFNFFLIPLGGIRLHNLNKIKLLNTDGFAVMSVVKKKPAEFINRLF